MKKLMLAVSLVLPAVLGAQQQQDSPSNFALTIDNVMRGPELVGNPPASLRWSGDSKELYFEWLIPKDDTASTWVVSRAGGAPRRLTEAERRLAPLPNGLWDSKRQRMLGIDRGDVVIIDTVNRTRLDVTRTTGNESSPRWARGESHVTFVRDNNLFVVPVQSVGTGTLVQLTDAGPKREDPKTTASQKFVKEEDQKLLTWVEQESARRKRREALDRSRALPHFDLTDRQTVVDGALSADGKYAYLMVNDRAQARTAQVPRFVSESAYTEEIASRTKVGDDQDNRRLAILNLETGEAVWAGVEGVVDRVAIPKPADGAEKQTEKKEGEKEDPPKPDSSAKRAVRWGALFLSPDGRQAVAVVRAADNADRWLVGIDPASGATKILDHLHDEAWIRDIGSQNNVSGGIGWLPDNRRAWFLAERDGWMHLYTVDVTAEAPMPKQLTTGTFEIDSVELAPDGRTFYIQSTEEHPGERHIYAMSVDGGARTKLTSTPGSHQGTVSPDNSTFALVTSTSNRPPDVFLQPNRAGAPAMRVSTSFSPEWESYKWVEPQLVTYKARDGALVSARLYTPEMVGARRHPTAPAVIFVHGAGYLQNAHRYWSSYSREYMFHHILASKGYVVLDPDYRGSAGYGRDWRTAIYRWMGGHDLNDVVDGAAFLAATQKVNARADRRLRRQLRWVHHADGAVHISGYVCGRGGAPSGHRLGPLQPHLYVEHPQRAARRRRSLSQELADLLRGELESGAADLPRHGRHQRSLPGFGPAGSAADRTAEGELGTRRVSGRGSRLCRGHELG